MPLHVVSDSFLRHDPAGRNDMFFAYFSEIVVENEAGKTLAVDRLKIDGQAFRESCPGTSGSFTAQGTMIIAGLDFASRAGRRRASEDQARPRRGRDRLNSAAEISGHSGSGADQGRVVAKSGTAYGLVRGKAFSKGVAACRTQKIEMLRGLDVAAVSESPSRAPQALDGPVFAQHQILHILSLGS